MSSVHAHSHHEHHHEPGENDVGRALNRRRLVASLLILSIYLVAEIVGGLMANSLALLADAGHMLSDIAALALSAFAMWVSQRPPTAKRTYGYYRAEILAALANAAALLALTVFIFYESYQRFRQPPEVAGGLMLGVAVGGLIVNLITLRLLHHGREESLNVRGAWLHVLGDTLGSVGVIVSGTLIWLFDWRWADPAASAVIGALIIYSSWSLIKESVAVLMEGAPGHIDVDEVNRALRAIPGVGEVHDLHVWTITSGMVSLSCHLVPKDNCRYAELLAAVRSDLHDRFGIDHVTIQIEPSDFRCVPCC